jgi:hypothetical protein
VQLQGLANMQDAKLAYIVNATFLPELLLEYGIWNCEDMVTIAGVQYPLTE